MQHICLGESLGRTPKIVLVKNKSRLEAMVRSLEGANHSGNGDRTPCPSEVATDDAAAQDFFINNDKLSRLGRI